LEEKAYVHMLTNMHHPPAEGTCHDKNGNAQKPVTVEYYNQHVGYDDTGDNVK
jgi:hypothetical protein